MLRTLVDDPEAGIVQARKGSKSRTAAIRFPRRRAIVWVESAGGDGGQSRLDSERLDRERYHDLQIGWKRTTAQ